MHLSAIHRTSGRAAEYWAYGLNCYMGCSFGCTYCSAPQTFKKDRALFHTKPTPRPNVLKNLKLDCDRLRDWDLDNNFDDTGVRKTNPPYIWFCPQCDPCQPVDREYQLTRKAIEIIHERGIGVAILTKADRVDANSVIRTLWTTDWFGVTLTQLYPKPSREWEPNAGLPIDRINALQDARALEIRTWVSLEPVLNPLTTLRLIECTSCIVDHFKIGILNYHPLAKEIDWHDFGHRAKELLDSLGYSQITEPGVAAPRTYYLKRDLVEKMGNGGGS